MKNRRRQRSPNSESPDEENRSHRVHDAATSCSPIETSAKATASTNEPVASEDSRRASRMYPKLLILFFLAAILLLAYSSLSKLHFLQILTLLPVGLCVYVGLRRNQALSHRILPLTLVATTVSAQFPAFLGAAIAATAVVAFGLATLPANQKQHSTTPASPLPVLLGTLVLVTVLLTENFMVWVVSATFEPSHSVETAPPPLQDNGQLMLKWFLQDLQKHQVVSLRRMWNVQWGLVACLGASFVIADVYSGSRRLYRLGCRAVLTLAAARFIRTISFLLTVLPSQHSNCYTEHYPNPPPTDTWEWIWVGLLPASHGGCNDLIISGHATVTSTMASVAASVSKEPLFCLSLWSMVVLDYMVEIYEGFHYSVDMWLGMVIVSLLWRVLAPIEANDETSADNAMDPPKTSAPMSLQIVVLYCLPAIVAYMQLTVLPQWSANFLIVAYVVWVGVLHFGFAVRQTKNALQRAYQHYCQHVLFCLLYMALGVYL